MLHLFLLLAFATRAALPGPQMPQDSKPAGVTRFPKDLDKWLLQGEHQAVPWKVRLEKPVLTFQQRQVIKAVGKIDPGALQSKSGNRHLLFIIKVAGSDGKWFPGGNFVTQDFDKPLDTSSDVRLESEVLLRPGRYTIAAVMYDSVLDQHNVSLLPVEVSPPRHDPLPDLLRNVPDAEFVRGDIKGEDTFGVGKPFLPLHNHRPIQLELLVDLSTRERQFRAAFPPTFSGTIHDLPRPPHFRRLRDQSYFIRLLQTASVLSALQPDSGCALVSSFDAIKEKTILPPTSTQDVDWLKLRDDEFGPEKDTISVNALSERKDLAQFVQRQFDDLVHSPACSQPAQKPLRIVLVLSHGLQLPEGSHKIRFGSCDCSVFYLRQADTAMNFDELKGMLGPLGSRNLQFDNPGRFRKTLAGLIVQIQKLAQ